MYLYDIDENTCINLDKIETIKFDAIAASIYFYNERNNVIQVKRFTKKEEARKEYERIKEMINNPPVFMTLDNGKANDFIKRGGN
jgi:hypothetical protein